MNFLPEKDRQYLASKGIAYEQREEGGTKAIVLNSFAVPASKYDAEVVDVLIFLPPGYPDACPDMFHTIPWLKLSGSGSYPRAADQPVVFNGVSWQRWSRHNNDWRPGADGIWTMIKRIENAIEIAA